MKGRWSARLRGLFVRVKSRVRPRSEPAPAEREPNLLVISDLHLGEDCKPTRSMSCLRRLALVELKLSEFLDHYRDTRHEGRAWRLIINGDMIDFIHVHMVADDCGDSGDSVEEHRFGLGTGPSAVDAKLERVFGRHEGVFRRLAAFVAAGHEIGIVIGNHDVEFHWSRIQESFRRRLARLAPEGKSQMVRDGIQFYPWFYLQKGLLYIEHGHQYDPTSSWDAFLDPQLFHRDGELQLNLSSASIRYFANLEPQLDPHGQTHWTLKQYVLFGWAQGVKAWVRLFSRYVYMSWRIIGLWRQSRHAGRELRRKNHLRRIHLMADRIRVPVDTLLELDSLRRIPVTYSLIGLCRVLYLDRVLVWLGASVLLGMGAWVQPGAWAWIAPAVVLPSLVFANWFLAARRHVDPGTSLIQMAQRIHDVVDVPLVVFGHTHDAKDIPLKSGGHYFNTGTWVDGQDAGDGVPFTHLIVHWKRDRVRAELCRWEAESVPMGGGLGAEFQATGVVADEPAAGPSMGLEHPVEGLA